MLPKVLVVKAAVGISTMMPPPALIGDGGVIVAIAVVPLTKDTTCVGAIVVALARVPAGALVAIVPETEKLGKSKCR